MKIIFALLFSICLFCYNAQVVNPVGSTIKNGAATNAEDFNRSRSNKEKNNLNNKSEKSSEQNANEDLDEESSPAPLEAEPSGERIDLTYHFNYSLGYETANYVPGGETTIKQMTYYFGDSCSLFTMDGSLLLNDIRNKKTLILSEEAKTGFNSIYLETSAEAIGDMNRGIYAYKKSGQVKQIMGYECEEYVLTRENTKLSTIWSAIKNPLTKHNINPKFLSDQMLMSVNSMNPDPNGFVMEYNQYNSEGRLINTVKVTSLEPDEKTLKLGEYQITGY